MTPFDRLTYAENVRVRGQRLRAASAMSNVYVCSHFDFCITGIIKRESCLCT